MSMTRQTILASRPAAMVLALSLVASLSAPFLMLPRAKAATAPLACTENNNNGCTELSPTPPQDTVAVPPNIVLMLDDSGSMKSDYMPDFSYLKNGSNNDALIDASNNGVYYNPTVTYSPPPKADSTTAAPDTYPSQTDMTNVPQDGFGAQNPGVTVNLYTYDGSYECDHNDNCGNGTAGSGRGKIAFNTSKSVATGTKTITNNYDKYASSKTSCTNTFNANNGITGTFSYTAHSGNWWLNGTRYNGGGECQFQYNTTVPTYTTYNFFQFSTGAAAGPYTVYYVAASASDCANAPTPANCFAAGDTSGSVAPSGLTAGTNIANWFAYYHTRILTAKSGLMSAFVSLSPKYRFGFGSINGRNNGNLPSLTGTYGQNGNTIAQVQPFGDGTSGTQKAAFWNWVSTVFPGNSTPLRRSLQAVGEYYKSSQPWTTMSGDPGYTSTGTNPTYACRASYAIMTTDGFWNGGNPTTPSGIVGAANSNGSTYTPPAGATYTSNGYVAQAPFSGGAVSASVASLADVATYYWETDLQTGLANEVAPTAADPAYWQHMTTYTMGLGFDPTGISGTDAAGNAVTIPEIFAWAHDVDAGKTSPASALTGFSWPTPSSNNIYNISDLAHAAVNGRGDFFSVKSPDDLTKGFAKAIADINGRTNSAPAASVNASVITVGAVAFGTSYNTGDWSGQLEAVALQMDGTVDQCSPLWNAANGNCPVPPKSAFPAGTLDSAFHSTDAAAYGARKVYSGAYAVVKDAMGNVTSNTFNAGFQFNVANAASLDATETLGLGGNSNCSGSGDTLCNRIKYLLGDSSNEGTLYRTRSTLLGAIVRSQPVYVSRAASNYYNNWPNQADGTVAPEAATGAQTYDAFVTQESTRPGTVYVGANDGMLHAFNAPVPTCTTFTSGVCTTYAPGTNAGKERFAFIPRAVYANLGNLTVPGFSYRPTVDETPVTRDVFFSDQKWHTMLAGGVGLGGRGVYALDITDPTAFSGSKVLWEFDSDATPDSGCFPSYGTCKATDLGYTVSKPNIGRLHNGKWAVLVSNGYFPDCTTPDTPTNDTTNCQAIAAQAPKDATNGNKPYSALFVLDAETGKMIAELKTPTNITGVTSFGLATPVLGDYNNDQVDDVAFAGDAQGNLWRFDLQSSDPTKWTVTLAYKGLANASGVQGQQPITSQPRLFPDPSSNRFIVLFGTGKFLGVGDNSNNTVQAIMGVRDQGSSATSAMAYSQTDLVQQYMHEEVEPAFMPDGTTPNPLAGVTVRCVTGGASDSCDASSATQVNDSMSKAGWFINLKTTASDGTQTDAGERVVVNPGAIFASNTVIFETLITGSASSDPCSPSTQGAIVALNAVTGGPSGASSLGGWPIVGGRVSNARTSGSLPLVSTLGGGQVYLPGTGLAPSGKPLSLDAPIWRRRSWQELNENQ